MSETSVLDIDIGNTRLKWCLRSAQSGAVYGACNDSERSGQLAKLEEAMAAHNASPSRVRVASVASDASNATLSLLLQRTFSIAPEMAKTGEECRGLRNSYTEPAHMGVDRWLAMLAARELLPSRNATALCVVDAGSALTLDFVAPNGSHEGGYILPGRRMQIDALLSNTGRVFADPEPGCVSIEPANSTSDAVHRGVLASMAFTIEGACGAFLAQYPDAAIYMGGGDAARLQPLLSLELIDAPNLVLDGLPLLLP